MGADLPSHLENCRQEALRLQSLFSSVPCDSGGYGAVQQAAGAWLSLLDAAQHRGSIYISPQDGFETAFECLLEKTSATIASLRMLLTNNCRSGLELPRAAVRQLVACVELHAKAVSTIMTAVSESQELNRWAVPRSELSELSAEMTVRKASLDARLKNAFDCSTAALHWNRVSGTSAFPKTPGRQSAAAGSAPRNDGSFLSLIGAKAAEFSRQVSQASIFGALLRAAVYQLAIIEGNPEAKQSVELSEFEQVQLYVHLHTCAWVVHNILEHPDSQNRDMGGVTQLLLKSIIDQLSIHDNLCSKLISVANLQRCDICIVDPLQDTQERDENRSQSSLGKTPEKGGPDNSHTTYPNPEPRLAYAIEPGSDMDTFTLSTASSDKTTSIDHQNWELSKAYIPKLRQAHKDFCIRVCTEKSFVIDIPINPRRDLLVPGYAYKRCPPCLWIKQEHDEPPLLFSTPSSDCEELVDFSEAVMRKQITYIPSGTTEAISIEKNSIAGRNFYTDSAVMILSPLEDDIILQNSQIGSQSGKARSSIGHSSSRSQNSDVVDTWGRTEPSRIVLFFNYSICCIPITNRLQFQRPSESTNTCLLIFDPSAGVYIDERSRTSWPGIPLSWNTETPANSQASKPAKDIWTVTVSFSGLEGVKRFHDKLESSLKRWRENQGLLTEKEPPTQLYVTKSKFGWNKQPPIK